MVLNALVSGWKNDFLELGYAPALITVLSAVNQTEEDNRGGNISFLKGLQPFRYDDKFNQDEFRGRASSSDFHESLRSAPHAEALRWIH